MFSASGAVPVGAIRNWSTLSSSRSAGELDHEIDEVEALSRSARRARTGSGVRTTNVAACAARASRSPASLLSPYAVQRVRRVFLRVATDLRAVEDVVGAHGHELRSDRGAVPSERSRRPSALTANASSGFVSQPATIVIGGAVHDRVRALAERAGRCTAAASVEVRVRPGHRHDVLASVPKRPDDVRTRAGPQARRRGPSLRVPGELGVEEVRRPGVRPASRRTSRRRGPSRSAIAPLRRRATGTRHGGPARRATSRGRRRVARPRPRSRASTRRCRSTR